MNRRASCSKGGEKEEYRAVTEEDPDEEGKPFTLETAIAAMNHNADVVLELATMIRKIRAERDEAAKAVLDYWEAWQDAAVYWKQELEQARADRVIERVRVVYLRALLRESRVFVQFAKTDPCFAASAAETLKRVEAELEEPPWPPGG